MGTTAAVKSQRQQLRLAVVSGYLGTTIEYYDFLLYATASALVFDKVFFSDLSPALATIASLGTLAAGYIARPLGGVIFGHFGDRVSRKRMLVLSMTIMGVASTLIGLLPTYASIGAWAPVLLVFMRVIQGIAVGGEWGGAVLMAAEHATSRRGLWASFGNAGAPSGMVLSTAILTLCSGAMSNAEFISWGWRIPFLFSAVLLVIGLVVRLRLDEPPAFTGAVKSAPSRLPLLDVLRHHPKNLALSIGMGVGYFVSQATLTTFVIAYAVNHGFERQTVLNALTTSSVVAVIATLIAGGLSDRFGRRALVAAGAGSLAIWSFVLFPLIDSGSTALLVLAVVVGQGILLSCWFGPLAALYAELFPTRYRYTGASLGFQVSAIGGGLAPGVFASVVSFSGGPLMVSIIMAVLCLISIGCVLALRETSRLSLDDLHTPATDTASASDPLPAPPGLAGDAQAEAILRREVQQ
ncbi:MFS transporter [Streptomyces sp. P9-A2]|uniref:MFS transporter n=1 Tax=Streptomyces sp. P9-A2 TaxID=3072284 RepID=UPI002FC99A7D